MHPQLLEASILGHGVRKEGFFGRVTFAYQRWSVLECVGVCRRVVPCVADIYGRATFAYQQIAVEGGIGLIHMCRYE